MKCARVLVVAAVFSSACHNPTVTTGSDIQGSRSLVASGFTVALPPGWEIQQLPGIDSSVGEIRGDGITLSYDLGRYSAPITAAAYPDHVVTDVIIDGRHAKIAIPKVAGNGLTGVHFPDLGNGSRLTMTSRDLSASQQDVALKIFRSIRFTN